MDSKVDLNPIVIPDDERVYVIWLYIKMKKEQGGYEFRIQKEDLIIHDYDFVIRFDPENNTARSPLPYRNKVYVVRTENNKNTKFTYTLPYGKKECDFGSISIDSLTGVFEYNGWNCSGGANSIRVTNTETGKYKSVQIKFKSVFGNLVRGLIPGNNDPGSGYYNRRFLDQDNKPITGLKVIIEGDDYSYGVNDYEKHHKQYYEHITIILFCVMNIITIKGYLFLLNSNKTYNNIY